MENLTKKERKLKIQLEKEIKEQIEKYNKIQNELLLKMENERKERHEEFKYNYNKENFTRKEHIIRYKNDIEDYKIYEKNISKELENIINKDIGGIILKYLVIDPKNDIVRKIFIEILEKRKYNDDHFYYKNYLKNYKLNVPQFIKLNHLFFNNKLYQFN